MFVEKNKNGTVMFCSQNLPDKNTFFVVNFDWKESIDIIKAHGVITH